MSELGRLERRYRRLLVLYPRDHRREHGEEMVGVLLAAARDVPAPGPRLAAWAVRSGQHAADGADLIAGALRIRGRGAVNRIRRVRWLVLAVRALGRYASAAAAFAVLLACAAAVLWQENLVGDLVGFLGP